MCVLRAERKTTERALVKDRKTRRALGRSLGADLLGRFGASVHDLILLRADK
jgi:hypothetical protein